MPHLVHRWRLRLRDGLQGDAVARLVGAGIWLASRCLPRTRRPLKIYPYLLRRLDAGGRQARVLGEAVARARAAPRREPTGGALERSIILKAPAGPNERGVLLVSFERELAKLAGSDRFAAIERAYQICFLPSSDAFRPAVLALAARATRPYAVLPAFYEREIPLYAPLGDHCWALPFNAASWVNADLYPARRADRDFDICMLALWIRAKRHWRLFEAMAQMTMPPRVCLMGVPWRGRTQDDIRAEARAFGVADQITIIDEPSQQVIRDVLSRSRMKCLLSRREGSCVAVVEALMAGTPVGMYRDAHVGSRMHINERTGVLLDPARPLGPQLEAFLPRADTLRPDLWAREHLAAAVSSRRLNDALRERSLAAGADWTRDLAPVFRQHFIFHYSDPEDESRLAPVCEDFRRLTGLSIRRPGGLEL
ncbi:MAG: glycosyltransferase [Candidatus Krumholzibacteriota bacterium]|nr:glycosyltransferase [Candidatus Krumholzibacteriota bacterium]